VADEVATPGGGEQPPVPVPAPAPQQPTQPTQPQREDRPHRGSRGPRGGGGGFGRRNRPGGDSDHDKGGEDLTEKVVFINRSSKVVKGGRRFKFSALVVVGDRKGRVGLALGKASEVADAIRRGGELARTKLVSVRLKDVTIPHQVYSQYGGAKVLLRPASPGTGVIAGKTVRSVLEAVGIKDVLSKSLGSKNAANVVKATLKALLSLRLREDIFKSRGLELKKIETPKAPEATTVIA
jgi:small subunit ribosomal protein S5